MSTIIQSIRGMRDILPDETPLWQYVENTLKQIIESYSYKEIRMPIVEDTELFKRSIGDVTDIVEKEMYTFEDKNGDSLTLRPEGTAGCVRAGIQAGLLYHQQRRLWYMGPMFRHEHPQKGRYRQFYQLGVETFGYPGPDIDAEIILMTARFWKALGLTDQHVALQLNSLGSSETRKTYRKTLTDYLSDHFDQLDSDSKRRLKTNPLRILDSKNPEMAILIKHAPKLLDALDKESSIHFNTLCDTLTEAGLSYEINPCLVRGLDYYSRTVFEWVTDKLGAQGTICAGGRFDYLVEQLGGHPTPAIGFAMGLGRTINLLQELKLFREIEASPQIYIAMIGDTAQKQGLCLAERLREAIPHLRILSNCGEGNLKNQLKKADKSGARFALILGEQESKDNTVLLKYLREDKPQETISLVDTVQVVTALGYR